MEQYYERCSSGNRNYVEDLFKYFFNAIFADCVTSQ